MSPPMRPTDKLLAAVMATGIYVVVEPAPFDLFIVLAAGVLLLSRRLFVPRSTLLPIALLSLFVVANVVSLVFSRDMGRSLFFMAVTLYLVGLWFILVAAQGWGKARTTDAILKGYAFGGALAAIFGVAGYLGAPVLGPLMAPDGRLHGLFKDPNVYGAYLVPVVLIAVYMLIAHRDASRPAWLAVLAGAGSAVFLSFSRGAWGNLGIGLAVFFFLFSFADGLGKTWWRTFVLFPPVLLLLAVVAVQLLSVDAVSNMFEIRFGMQSYDDLRFRIQAQAASVALEYPLGLGPGMTEKTFTVAAHSTYVRSLVEHGFLGLFSIVALVIVSILRSVWMAVYGVAQQDRLRFALVAGALCGMAVESGVIDTIHWRHYFVFLALAWAPAPRLRSENGRPQ